MSARRAAPEPETAAWDPARLPVRLTALQEALALGADRLDPDAVAEAERVVGRAGERMRLSAEHTVVALAGPTGSGKSTLFNALAGLDLAETGVRRPTTSEALACVWGPEGAGELLAWLDIPRRHRVVRESVLDADRERDLRGLVLLDLPDHDSTTLSHRLEVDRLVELVDLLVWVVDPQKYADAALHEQYLRPLAGHADVTLVVLNQVDRLDPAAREACQADLRRLLREDGIDRPRVVAASARTGEGVERLRRALAGAVADRGARVARALADLDGVADALLPGTTGEPGRTGEDERAALDEALAAAAGVPGIVDAVERSVRHRAVLATGWPFTRWVRGLRRDPLRSLGLGRRDVRGRSSVPEPTATVRAQVDLAVRRAADAMAGTLTDPWADGVRAAARGGTGDLADALDRAVSATELGADRGSWWWGPARALQWLLAAAVVVGLGWLAALAVVGYLQLPDVPTPHLGRVPLPTLLVLGGALLGLLLAGAGRLAARATARTRAVLARRRLRKAVDGVAERAVLAPAQAEVDRWRRTRELLQEAARR